MNKRIFRILVGLAAAAALLGSYEAYAYYQYVLTMHRVLGACSARMSVVLSHTEYDPPSLDHALRGIGEAIVYVDAMLDEARTARHIPSRLRDERSLRYMRLCGETLRKGESFAQAARAYALPALSPAPGHGTVAATAEQSGAGREQRYNELVRRHAALRVQLTELYNENYEMRGAQVPLEELVDAGSIEHAQQEINVYYGRAD